MLRTAVGGRFVRYRGKTYVLAGLYLSPGSPERMSLFLVLRRADDCRRAATLTHARERSVLSPFRIRRPFANALLVTIALALFALLGLQPHPVAPPRGAEVGARSMTDRQAGGPRPAPSPASPSAPLHPTAIRSLPNAPRPRSASLPVYRWEHPISHSDRSPETQHGLARVSRRYAISFGSFDDALTAEAMAQAVRAKGYMAKVIRDLYGVRVRGHLYQTRGAAVHMAEILRGIGLPATVERTASNGASARSQAARADT